jgi:hypothetical protein
MPFSIKHIVRTERDNVTARQYMMSTTFHHATNVKVVHVQKVVDCDSKEISRSKLFEQSLRKEVFGSGVGIVF